MSRDTYRSQHAEALKIMLAGFEKMGEERLESLKPLLTPYLDFRARTARVQAREFSALCTERCFSRKRADCCGKNAIAVFFADMVINSLVSGEGAADLLLEALEREAGDACVYLSEEGCLFGLKPIACEMFLCHRIKEELLEQDRDLAARWEELKIQEKEFTWPSKPVLFDTLEALFIDAGFSSPLMYCHNSPGLLNLKEGWKR